MINMNQDINNFDRVDDELQDDWLKNNLNLIQMEPTQNFTKKVVEQIEINPNTLSNSPLFWILAIIPATFLVWLAIYALNTINFSDQLGLDFLPKISSMISLFTLSKYVLMVVFGGLFFIGLDYFLSKRISHRESFMSFLLV